MTRHFKHVDGSMEEFFEKSMYRHRVESTYVSNSGWTCSYVFWWTMKGSNGEELPGERRLTVPSEEEWIADTVSYKTRAEAEAALWDKVRTLDLDAKFDVVKEWRRLPGTLAVIGTFKDGVYVERPLVEPNKSN